MEFLKLNNSKETKIALLSYITIRYHKSINKEDPIFNDLEKIISSDPEISITKETLNQNYKKIIPEL